MDFFLVGGMKYFGKQLYDAKIINLLCKIKGIQYEFITYTYEVEYRQCLWAYVS